MRTNSIRGESLFPAAFACGCSPLPVPQSAHLARFSRCLAARPCCPRSLNDEDTERKEDDFGAQSHGFSDRCLRFAARVAPAPRKTRSRLVANPLPAGLLPARAPVRSFSRRLHDFLSSRLCLAQSRLTSPARTTNKCSRPPSTGRFARSRSSSHVSRPSPTCLLPCARSRRAPRPRLRCRHQLPRPPPRRQLRRHPHQCPCRVARPIRHHCHRVATSSK